MAIWIYNDFFINRNHGNSKHQKPIIKQISMTKIQNRQHGHQLIDKSSKCLGHWSFEFGNFLDFGILDFGPMIVVKNFINLVALSSTWTFLRSNLDAS